MEQIVTGMWKQCFLCRRPTAMEDLVGRQEVVQVMGYQRWWGFSPFQYKTYGMVDVCPDCDQMQESAACKKARIAVGAVSGWGIAFFSSMILTPSSSTYLTLIGLGVMFGALLGSRQWGRSRRALIPTVERKEDRR